MLIQQYKSTFFLESNHPQSPQAMLVFDETGKHYQTLTEGDREDNEAAGKAWEKVPSLELGK